MAVSWQMAAKVLRGERARKGGRGNSTQQAASLQKTGFPDKGLPASLFTSRWSGPLLIAEP